MENQSWSIIQETNVVSCVAGNLPYVRSFEAEPESIKGRSFIFEKN